MTSRHERRSHDTYGGVGLAGRTVAVLGGHSFVGSHLVETLVDEGARVRALCRRGVDGTLGCFEHVAASRRRSVDVCVGRVADAALVYDVIDGADAVFYANAHHLAAPQGTLPDSDDHTAAAMLLIAALERLRVGRIVWVWAGDHARPPAWAGMRGRTSGPSVVSMLAAQRILTTFAARGLPLIRLAPSAVYGPRQPVAALVPAMLSQLDTWMDPVTVPGPVPRQEYVYVEDLTRALVAATGAPPGCYELRTGAALPIGRLFAACCEVMRAHAGLRCQAMPLGPPLDGMDEELLYGAGGRPLPGWAPRVPLREGLRRTADWLLPARLPGIARTA